MLVLSFILAAGSLSSLCIGAPLPKVALSARNVPESTYADNAARDIVKRSNTYKVYGGNGLVSNGWPAQSAWVANFETMFAAQSSVLSSSCAQWNVANNSPTEIAAIKSSILTVAAETGVDSRFILAIMMQESNGCVRAPTTNWGVRNPGLMQDHDGAATCNEGGVQNPCPAATITQMIRDGAAGTPAGEGLKQTIARSGATDVSKYYKAARLYNSGSVDASGNLGMGIATHCYASDIANRLTGWSTGPSGCSEAGVGALTGTASTGGNGNTPTTPASPTVTKAATTPTAKPATPAPVKQVGDKTPKTQKAPGASASCKGWYSVASGDVCSVVEKKLGVSMANLMKWNSQLKSDCSNLWLGYSYCVSA
jgi:LysM repeat protein